MSGLDPEDVVPRERVVLPALPKNDDKESLDRFKVATAISMRTLKSKPDALWLSTLTGIPYQKVVKYFKEHKGKKHNFCLRFLTIFMFCLSQKKKN